MAFTNAHGCVCEDCTFDDFELDGVYAGGNGTMYSQTVGGHCTDITFRRLAITNCRRNGISITHCDGFLIEDITASGCNVGVLEHSRYDAATIDIEPNSGCIASNGVIRRCDLTALYSPALAIARLGATKENIEIYDVTIDATNNYGMSLNGLGENWNVHDCTITVTNGGGIWIHAQGETIVGFTARDNVIYGDDTAFSAGIGITTVTDALVEGNEIHDFARAVLAASGSAGDVIDNHFASCVVRRKTRAHVA